MEKVFQSVPAAIPEARLEKGLIQIKNEKVEMEEQANRNEVVQKCFDKIVAGLPKMIAISRLENPKRKWILVSCDWGGGECEIGDDHWELLRKKMQKNGFSVRMIDNYFRFEKHSLIQVRDSEVPDSDSRCNIL